MVDAVLNPNLNIVEQGAPWKLHKMHGRSVCCCRGNALNTPIKICNKLFIYSIISIYLSYDQTLSYYFSIIKKIIKILFRASSLRRP